MLVVVWLENVGELGAVGSVVPVKIAVQSDCADGDVWIDLILKLYVVLEDKELIVCEVAELVAVVPVLHLFVAVDALVAVEAVQVPVQYCI